MCACCCLPTRCAGSHCTRPTLVAELEVAGTALRILATRLPGTQLDTWLLEHPLFSERPGNPYHDPQGKPWPDNADRFMLFVAGGRAISTGETALDWRPDVLHCNDWHTGPAIALAHLQRAAAAHGVHHPQPGPYGDVRPATFDRLGLPEHFWQDSALEYYDQCSFIKGGLVYADYITTVSPTYAREICECARRHGAGGPAEPAPGSPGGHTQRHRQPGLGPRHRPLPGAALWRRIAWRTRLRNKVGPAGELGLAAGGDRPAAGLCRAPGGAEGAGADPAGAGGDAGQPGPTGHSGHR